MIDSHTHLYAAEFDDDREAMVTRAQAAGVTHVILPNENVASVPRLVAMQESWPEWVSIAIGLHPEEVHDDWHDALAQLRSVLDKRPCVAVGEIGVDLYWDKTWREQQLEVLDTQLHWCVEKNIPFIIHCREALDEILWVMDNFGEPLPQGVFHCFAGTTADVERVRKRGDFYFGVNGVVTFKKSTISALLPVIGLERLLLETDAPYLAPVPYRGKRNESAYIAAVRDFIAAQLDIAPQQVDEATSHNARLLFQLEQCHP
ncbi:MAG: TatD family hydrolase [Muribaculaceae bacterium]|nr:TatD family hydrolase [Muribaculaceae bacterium]